MREDSFENSREKLMFLYGLTQKDMFADPDALSNELLRCRFLIEFGQVPGYFGFVTYGICINGKLHVRPDNAPEEDELKIMRESLKNKKNLFETEWKKTIVIKDDVDY